MKIKFILLVVSLLLLAWSSALFIEFFWNKVLLPVFGLSPMPFLLAWGIGFLGIVGAVVIVIVFLHLSSQQEKETERELLERS